MIRVFRSPRSRSVAAATTPERLAREFDSALWRERPDGGLEVATMRDRRVERYLVHEDGSTTLVASQSPTALERHAAKLVLAAWGLAMAGVFVAGALGSPEVGVAMFFVAFALFAFFARAANAEDLAERLKKWAPGDWHEPTNLHEWTPRSMEQLAAVEHIADEHDGLAFVRDNRSTVDVYAMRHGKLELYWVDERGRSGSSTIESHTGAYHADRILKTTATVLWLAILAVLFGVSWHKFLLLGLLAGSLALLLFVGWRNARRLSLEQHVKRLPPDGRPWIEIRTKIEEDGGE